MLEFPPRSRMSSSVALDGTSRWLSGVRRYAVVPASITTETVEPPGPGVLLELPEGRASRDCDLFFILLFSVPPDRIVRGSCRSTLCE